MNIKKFFGLLMVLTVAIFAFTACSSDDDEEKVGTFEYAIGYPSFEGGLNGIQKIYDAFKQAFGVTDKTFKLTGTQSECNRKAKELSMKVQAALTNEGSLSGTINIINVTTGEKIHSFTIKVNDNEAYPQDKVKLGSTSITFYEMKGYLVSINYYNEKGKSVVFDGHLDTNEENFDLKTLLPEPFLPTDSYYPKGQFMIKIVNESTQREWNFLLVYSNMNHGFLCMGIN